MYQPKPGTVVYKAIEYLKTLPPGTQDCKQLSMYCTRAVKAGLLQRRQIPGLGVVRWWSLPGHALIAVPGEDPEPVISDDDLAPRRAAPEIQPRPGPFLPGVNVGAGSRWITPVQIGA